MKATEKKDILEQISQNPVLVALVLEGVKIPHKRYISNLILRSGEVNARRNQPWEYKSLLEYGEEHFVQGGGFGVLYRTEASDPSTWHDHAAKALAYEVSRSIFENDEGLILYVHEGAKYRPARPGDTSYDFVMRLLMDGNLSGISIDKPISWAQELFVCKSNLESFALVWHEGDYQAGPTSDARKRVRREAVWLETLRRNGVKHYANFHIPSPDTWPDSSFAAEQSVALEKPLSTRERNTLLRIIGVLCKDAKIDYRKPALAAGLIQHSADNMGVEIPESTIESHLKKIADALAARMK